ncbi:MAG: YceI family protein [Solirubrobacteraceae bacterium]
MSTSPHTSHTQHDDLTAGRWQLDPARSSVAFHVPHFWGLITVKGRFTDYAGTLDLSAQPAVQLTIDAASLDTGNRQRDKHLRSPDFFDVEHHPQVHFLSDRATPNGTTLEVRGQLHARGAQLPLELDATIRPIDSEFAIEARTQAAHRELGMLWSPLGIMRPISSLIVTGRLVRAAQ